MRSALRFVAGAIAAGVLWTHSIPAYHSILCAAATPLLQLDGRLSGAVAERVSRGIQVRKPQDLDFSTMRIPADELTYNLILFFGLLAVRRGGWRRTLPALLAVVATHVVAVVLSIEAAYATKVAGWSESHYGGREQDFWTAAEYAYRLAGMFAIAFAAWWLSLEPGELSLLPEAPREKSPRSGPA